MGARRQARAFLLGGLGGIVCKAVADECNVYPGLLAGLAEPTDHPSTDIHYTLLYMYIY